MARAARASLAVLSVAITLFGSVHAQDGTPDAIHQQAGSSVPPPLDSSPTGQGPVTEPPPRTPLGIFDPVPEWQRTSSEPGCSGRGDNADGEFFKNWDERSWTAYADAIFLQRSCPRDAALITNNITPGATMLLGADDFNFNMEAGFRAGMMIHHLFGTEWGVEGSYFGVDNWESETGIIQSPGGAAVRFITPLGHPTLPTQLAGAYASELDSAEVNARRRICDRLTFLAGVRYLRVTDSVALALDFNSEQNLMAVGLGTKNELLGFQIGADGLIWSRGRLGLSYMLKAGVFNNDAENLAFAAQTSPLRTGRVGASENHVAFVGETGLMGICHLTEDLAVRAGYQVLWIDGVALAPDQMAVSDLVARTATVETSSLFYHGAFVGLEISR
jgi:hypothetical protein